MAVHWHWAFGNESAANLNANTGFFCSHTPTFWCDPKGSASEVYSYVGSPQRYSLFVSSAPFGSLTLPPAAGNTVTKGWIAVPFKSTVGIANRAIINTSAAGSNTQIATTNMLGTTATLALSVDNVFKGTTLGSFDFSSWQYVALKFDMSTTTHSAEIWVNGALELGPFTDPSSTTATSQSIVLYGASDTWLIGQIIVYNDTADAGHVPRFVTRVEPNADGTNTGTWTPSTGSDDYAVVDSPLDVTTYTEDGAPTVGNRLELLTSGGSSNLAAALGVNPSNIDSVLHHNFSDGATVDVQAKVGDGTSETAGATVTIPASGTTYAYAVANTRPSGGAWTGSDAPTLVYEIV